MNISVKLSLVLLCVILSVDGVAQEWCNIISHNATSTDLPRVLLLGDSITARYSSEVTQALKGKAYVSVLSTGRAVGSPVLLEEIALALSQHQFALIHFNNGLHSGQGYEIYRKGFPEFLDTIKRNSHGAKLVWATSTALRGWGKQVPELNKIAAEFIAQEHIPVDDLFGIMASSPNLNWWDGGGVHATPEGQALHAKQVGKAILAWLPEPPADGWADLPCTFNRRDVFEWCNISIPDAGQKKLPRILIVGDSPSADQVKSCQSQANLSVLCTSKSMGDPALLGELKLLLRQGPYAVIHFNNGLHSGVAYTPDDYRKNFRDVIETVKKGAPDAVLVWATTPPGRGEWMIKNEREYDLIAASMIAVSGALVTDFYEFAVGGKEAADRALKAKDRITATRQAAGDTDKGQNIDLALSYVQSIKALREKALPSVTVVPEAVAVERRGADLKLDGRLDEAFWREVPVYDFKDMSTGKPPVSQASFQVVWSDNCLVYGIRCEEPDTKGPYLTTKESEDPLIWDGDNIELLIETQAHSYYQITISPSGAVIDLDRKRGGLNTTWSSGVEVAAHAGDGFWSLEVRVPVSGANAEALNPLTGLAGVKPNPEGPWYFNLYRNRVRGNETDGSAFSPTGKRGLHTPLTFARLIVK